MILKFKKLREDAIIPQRQSEGASGFDVCYCGDGEVFIYPQFWKLLKTGIACEIPAGYELQVRSRSGLAYKNGIFVLNSPGTIDADYRGEIGVILFNTTTRHFAVKPGDRIAQLVPIQLPTVTVKVVTEISDTERGDGGFGSTGV